MFFVAPSVTVKVVAVAKKIPSLYFSFTSAGVALGADGLPSLAGLGVRDLAQAPRFRLDRLSPVGGDILQVWHPV